MLFQERFAPTSRRKAISFALRTLSVCAEATPIVVPSVTEQEDLNLMVGYTDAGALEEVRDRPSANAIESREVVETIDPDRKINIVAFVQNLDPLAEKRLEARNFTLEWARY